MLASILMARKTEYVSVAFWIALCLLASIGVSRLALDADYSAYFAKDDPLYTEFKDFQHKFSRQDELILLLETGPENTFPLKDDSISRFKAGLSELPAVNRVDGYNPNEFESATSLALSHKAKSVNIGFISPDANAVILSVSFNVEAVKGTKALLESVSSVNRYIEQFDIDFAPPFQVYYSGALALNWQYISVLKHDLFWFIPGLAIMFSLMLLLVVREKMWLLGIATSSLITMFLTLGLAGWGGFILAAISGFIPVVIVSLCVAYAVHLFFGWRNALDEGVDEQKALQQSLSINIKPLFWGALTTAMGFTLLVFSPSPPIQDFGKLVAFAVMVNFLVNLTILIPIAKRAIPMACSQKVNRGFFARIQVVSWHYRTLFLGSGLLLSLLAIYSVSSLKFDDDAMNYFPDSNLFSQSKLKMEQHFNGVNQLYYVVASQEKETHKPFDGVGIAQQDYVSRINQFSRFLRKQEEVLQVHSIVDWIRFYGLGSNRLNQVLSAPVQINAQASRLINADASASVVTVDLIPMTAAELISFEEKVAEWELQNDSEISIGQGLSQSIIFAHLSLSNAKTMLYSFGCALLFLLLIVTLLKGSFKLGGLALAMNLLPLIWVFGLWQWLGGGLSLGSAVVMGMMLGIIIDDSLHLLLKVDERECGKGLSKTFTSVMPAVAFTSLLLLLGFALGLSSDFFPIVELSFLSMLIVAFAFLFDLIMLPMLMILIAGGEHD
ncbi:efflux RND transporter permease subunit [Shewanella nanhaiensis]|uniref:MMPL family transporter n=1 Tax=Shewanella nanhaiensis TaxID=2864872 RepID=A0ABS7DY76_9GAMM|nr:MMPL family transporter [Shewanella nanhaiensis]MBW8182381.1 MMPL family transporter [Shewanella nanhaiensis]